MINRGDMMHTAPKLVRESPVHRRATQRNRRGIGTESVDPWSRALLARLGARLARRAARRRAPEAEPRAEAEESPGLFRPPGPATPPLVLLRHREPATGS